MSEWIVWDRKGMPVHQNAQVDVEFFDGTVQTNRPASDYRWHPTMSQITSYRLSEQQSMEEAYEQTHNDIGFLSALDQQISGTHYKKLAIQPVTYIHANNIGFMEGSAIKYLSRWRDKGGVDDLKKARHFIDMLIELEGK